MYTKENFKILRQKMRRFIYRSFFAIIEYLHFCILNVFKKHYVFVEFCNGCRFGNQIFFVSFGEMLSRKYGLRVSYYTPIKRDYVWLINDYIFQKIRILTFHKKFVKTFSSGDWNGERTVKQLRDALRFGNVLFHGCYESLDVLDLSISKSLLSVPLNIKKGIYDLYGDLSQVVSIHIRRGDFVKLGIALSPEYYQSAILKFPNAKCFLIISDDIEWCKKHLVEQNESVHFEYADRHIALKNSMLYDFFIPEFCGGGNIISCSTFGWWGAVLNCNKNAKIIAPYPWSGYLPDKNMYLPNMEKMPFLRDEIKY